MKGNVRLAAAIIVVLLLAVLVLGLVSCMTLKDGGGTRETQPSREHRYPISDEATERVLTSVRPSQDSRDSLYNNACYFQRRSKHKLAIEEFKRALAIDPNYTKAYNGIGISYDFLGDYSSAIDAYEKALALDPDLDYVYNNLGYCYLLKGELNCAIAAFRKAISLNDQNKLYHNNLGLAYAERGDNELALIELKLAGDADRAHFILGQISYQNGLYNEARTHFSQALALNFALRRAESYLVASSQLAEITREVETKSSTAFEPSGEVTPETQSQAPDATAIGTKSARETESSHSTSSLTEAEILIANGNGVRHMARRVGAYLGKYGFSRIRLANAAHFNHSQSRIYYCEDHRWEAYRVAELVALDGHMREVPRLSRTNVKIKLLLGKDLIPFLASMEKNRILN